MQSFSTPVLAANDPRLAMRVDVPSAMLFATTVVFEEVEQALFETAVSLPAITVIRKEEVKVPAPPAASASRPSNSPLAVERDR